MAHCVKSVGKFCYGMECSYYYERKEGLWKVRVRIGQSWRASHLPC